MKIDPKDFISPPYDTCPKCQSQRFGVLMVCDHHYVRRCEDCLFPNPHRGERHHIPLPPIRKKVIYLDQMAISNMMMALNPQSKAHQEGKYAAGTDGERWLTLFKKLDRLCKMQLIICPYSIFHMEESMVATHMREELKTLYEHLSYNTPFRSPYRIQAQQIHHFAQCWLTGAEPDFSNLEPESITVREIHIWTPDYIVTVEDDWTPEEVEEQRRMRKQGHEGLGDIADRWKGEEKTFDEYMAEEGTSYGKAIMRSYWHYLQKRYAEAFFPPEVIPKLGIEEVPPNHPHIQLVTQIHDAFHKAGLRNDEQEINDKTRAMFQQMGVPADQINTENIHATLQKMGLPNTQAMQKVGELLLSKDFWQKVPYSRIQSALWASLAVKSRHSKKKPNQGTFNDVELISTLLPYCDAMLLDKEWCNVLRNKPVSEKLGFPTLVFAPMYMDELFAYLDSIEASASPDHLAKVAEVYGEAEPYTSIFGLEETPPQQP